MNQNLTKKTDEEFFELMAIIKKEEDYYYFKMVPKIKKELREFVDEVKKIDSGFVKSRRSEYLGNEIKRLKEETKAIFKLFKKNGFSFVGDVILKINNYSEKKKRLKRLQFEYHSIKFNRESNQSLSEGCIEAARNADCAQFVDVKKRTGRKAWALCPFHEDTNPSLCCYEGSKGFFCFTCNKGGDAITLVRELHGLGFKDAVMLINKQ